MIRYLFTIAAIVTLHACQPKDVPGKCQTGDAFPYTAPYDMQYCPGDIQAWMDRANGCAHFAGEEPYDEERRADIEHQMTTLSCHNLGCDYERLFRQYEGDIVYAGVLSGYAALTFGSVDNLPICPQAGL